MPDRSLDESKTLLLLTEEGMICFGHHQPIFINPGSLGCNNKPSARYAIVNANETEIRIEMKEASIYGGAYYGLI
jgi:predicted phosphodiesterase